MGERGGGKADRGRGGKGRGKEGGRVLEIGVGKGFSGKLRLARKDEIECVRVCASVYECARYG